MKKILISDHALFQCIAETFLIRVFVDERETSLEVVTAYPMTLIFKDASVEESDEAKNGIIIDYDSQGDIVSIEIIDAKMRINQPTQVIYELAEQSASPGR
jgi:uncharacterized protein YuzE